MEAAGVLKDRAVPDRVEGISGGGAACWKRSARARSKPDVVGDAPFTFAAAANVPVKAIGAIRQSQEGLAILVPREFANSEL